MSVLKQIASADSKWN